MVNFTKKQRSYNMSRIKGKDTALELKVFKAIEDAGLSFVKHMNTIGKPDITFPDNKLMVFIDSDFWHGWRFPSWKNKLSLFWLEKIGENIKRDKNNTRKLRKEGWKVLRIWEHQLDKDFNKWISYIIDSLKP